MEESEEPKIIAADSEQIIDASQSQPVESTANDDPICSMDF